LILPPTVGKAALSKFKVKQGLQCIRLYTIGLDYKSERFPVSAVSSSVRMCVDHVGETSKSVSRMATHDKTKRS